MPNKYLRTTIIVTAQCIVPAILLFIIAPALMNHSGQFNQAQTFFKVHQTILLTVHGLFYLSLCLLWPRFINLVVSRQHHQTDAHQINIALSARWYLLAAMVFFELLMFWS